MTHQQIPLGVPQAQYGVCRTYSNFLCIVPILRWFRIVRCNWQAALHSALFNYNPLVIWGTSKNKQLTIIKPTQTGIYRNKYTLLPYKIIGASKKFKHQSRPLVRSSSLNFGPNFWNLSHETVPLKDLWRASPEPHRSVSTMKECTAFPQLFSGE